MTGQTGFTMHQVDPPETYHPGETRTPGPWFRIPIFNRRGASVDELRFSGEPSPEWEDCPTVKV